MSKPKIVHVITSLKMGGAEKVLYTLAVELADSFDQTVLYFYEGPFVQKLRDAGIVIKKISGFFCRYDPVFFARLYRQLYREQPQMIHALLWSAHIASRLCGYVLGVPVMTAYHNNVEQNGFVRCQLDRLTHTLSQHHIAVSDQVAQSIGYCGSEHITIIVNGITTMPRCSSLSKCDIGFTTSSFVIGAVGRLVAIKRFDLLIQAFADVVRNIPHARLAIVGVGPEYARLQSIACAYNVSSHVFFFSGDAMQYYAAFDCFVQPSDKEGISLALLEAMSYALPCVVMGEKRKHSVIVHNRTGLICVINDANALAKWIQYLAQSRNVRNTIGISAQQVCKKKFSLNNMADAYKKNFLSKIVQKNAE